MQHYICTTCGTQYPLSVEPPNGCVICNEERQYVNPDGQSWTTLADMNEGNRYNNEILPEEDGLYSLATKPAFGIGQTAYVIQGSGFNLLWDCVTFLDEVTQEKVKELGGIQAIALSHPHYYSAQVEWADVFDCPIYIHEDDAKWVVRTSPRIQFWSGESLQLSDDLTVHRLGGHFQGSSVIHWKQGYGGRGVLLTGDTIQVAPDQQWVSFMYSYPNWIPLPAKQVRTMADKVSGLEFKRIYNAFHRVVREGADECVRKSAQRYIAALEGTLFEP